MSDLDKFTQFRYRHPPPHVTFFNRPHFTRRRFFEVLGTGVVGSYLVGKVAEADGTTQPGATTQNTAKNCIFILMAGAPSHTDTFDLKVVNGVTPASFMPQSNNGIMWPTGLMPKLGNMLGDFAIIRSMRAHGLVHTLGQTWTQIGRNPAAALGNIAPHIGSVVAIEKDKERTKGQIFPAFLALNSNNAIGSGYLPAIYAPFKV